MAIGDDLQILLGMVPIRDRAGIARGTMADAAVAAANPHANGQELTRQGFDFARPPALSLPPNMGQDVQLPDNVNAEYTAGSGGSRLSPAKPPLKQPLPPPEPTERVIASSPAAAPSPEVIRGSDIMMKGYEQQLRQQRMQAIIQSIGGMVSSLQGQPVHGGGGAVAGGPDLNTLKTIIEMRKAENQEAAALAIRKQTIDELQRTNGYSPEYAAAKYDSGEYKDDLKQDTIAKREAAKLAGTTREELLKPENVDALSKRLGQPPDVIKADIRNGKIGAKELADIEGTQATTGKVAGEASRAAIDFGNRQDALRHPEVLAAKLTEQLGRPVSPTEISTGALTDESWRDLVKQYSPGGQVDITGKATTAAKTAAETRGKLADLASLEEAQKTPAMVAERYRHMGFTDVTEDVIKSAAASGPTWAKFGENHQPLSTADLRDLEVENRMREAKGQPKLTPSEYKQQSQRPVLKTPQEEVEGKVLDRYVAKAEDAQKRALGAKNFIEVDNEVLQRHMNASPKLLLGPFSEKKLETRAFIADLLNMTDQAVNDTNAFKAQLKEYGLKVNEAFKGNFSDKDQKTVDAIVGGNYSEATIRDIIELREKHQRLVWQAANNELAQAHAHPKHGEFIKSYAPAVEPPRMGTFMQNKFDAVGGEATAIPKLQAVRNDPRALDRFDKEWGAGLSRELLRKADAAAAATDKEGR